MPKIEFLQRLLDASDLRHRVIAGNVANVNTPGYRRQDVAFEDALVDAQSRAGRRLAADARPTVVEGAPDAARADGNTVDIDAEMGRLNKNSVLYHLYMQVTASQLATMRSAITGK